MSIRDKDKEALHASCVSLEFSIGSDLVGCFIIFGFQGSRLFSRHLAHRRSIFACSTLSSTERVFACKKFVNSFFKRNGRRVTFPDNSAGGINQDTVRDASCTKVCLCLALAICHMVMLDLGPGLFGDTCLERFECLVRSETYDSNFTSPVFLSFG